MFTLLTDKSRYFRIRRGQSKEEVESVLITPVDAAFAGKIICVQKNITVYRARVGDTYKSVAQKFGVDKDELEALNKNRPVYPTAKLFIPNTNPRA